MKRIEKLAIVLIVAGLLQGPAIWCLLHYSPVLLDSGGDDEWKQVGVPPSGGRLRWAFRPPRPAEARAQASG